MTLQAIGLVLVVASLGTLVGFAIGLRVGREEGRGDAVRPD